VHPHTQLSPKEYTVVPMGTVMDGRPSHDRMYSETEATILEHMYVYLTGRGQMRLPELAERLATIPTRAARQELLNTPMLFFKYGSAPEARTPLLQALLRPGYVHFGKWLLDNGADPNLGVADRGWPGGMSPSQRLHRVVPTAFERRLSPAATFSCTLCSCFMSNTHAYQQAARQWSAALLMAGAFPWRHLPECVSRVQWRLWHARRRRRAWLATMSTHEV
jgi:hypothetical protein